MSKEIKVVYSPGFGAGLSTWTPVRPDDPELIRLVETNASYEVLEAYCEQKYGAEYYGGLTTAEIGYVPCGSFWRIREYDGAETIEVFDPERWYKAPD